MSTDTLTDGFVTCPRGLESALADELSALGLPEVKAGLGGVAVVGSRLDLYRINLHSRLAGRVLRRIGPVKARDNDALYRSMRDLDWPAEFSVDRSFRIRVTARKSPLRSLNFATLKAKDAVCDRFRAEGGQRPDVDPKGAEVAIHLFIDGRKGWAYLDTTGAPLFQRGWRVGGVEAPLRENLAAGLLALSGWSEEAALVDPFCGGGTLLIEAARRRAGLPPGLERDFAFAALADYDSDGWRRLCIEAQESAAAMLEAAATLPPLLGRDRSDKALASARRNAGAAGVAGLVDFEAMDARDGGPPVEAGWLVTNPPYGQRLEAGGDLAGLFRKVGSNWRQHWTGWSFHVLSPDRRLPDWMGMSEEGGVALFNGDIACRLQKMAPPG